MTLNGVITLILHYFPPNLIAFQADYVTVVEGTYKVRCRISSSSHILAKTDPCSSCTVSLRQLSFLLVFLTQQQQQRQQ